jgi:hypothetical protein
MGTIKKTREITRTIGGVSLIIFMILSIRYLSIKTPEPKDLNLIWWLGGILTLCTMIELVIIWIQHIQMRKSRKTQEGRDGRIRNADQKYKDEQVRRVYQKSIANASGLLKPALNQFAKKHRLPICEISNCISHIVSHNPDVFIKKTIMLISAGNYGWRRNSGAYFQIKTLEVTDKTVIISYRSDTHEQTEVFDRY